MKQCQHEQLRQEYLRSLTCFLQSSTVYDCLSINNQITVADMALTIFDVFKIFIDSHVDEVLFWNQDIGYYDGVFTHTDLIKTTLKCYYNVLYGIPNIWTNITSPELIETEEQPPSPVKRAIYGKLTIDQFNQLLSDFKNISIKLWFNSVGECLHQNCLIQADLEDNLNDICRKFVNENITRIIVIEKETKMVTGIIQQKDILTFLVRGFSQYLAPKVSTHMNEQHELQMEYFNQELMKPNCTLPADTPVYDLFYKLIYTFKRNTVAIVDSNNTYLGLIDRRDFLFILKYQMFDILAQSAQNFLKLLITERSKYLYNFITNKETFSFKQTIKQVVENLLLSPRGSLVCLEKSKVVTIVQTVDLFRIFLSSDEI